MFWGIMTKLCAIFSPTCFKILFLPLIFFRTLLLSFLHSALVSFYVLLCKSAPIPTWGQVLDSDKCLVPLLLKAWGVWLALIQFKNFDGKPWNLDSIFPHANCLADFCPFCKHHCKFSRIFNYVAMCHYK